MSDEPDFVRIDLGSVRAALEHLAEQGLASISEEMCEAFSRRLGVLFSGLTPEQCAGIYAAMLLRALPKVD